MPKARKPLSSSILELVLIIVVALGLAYVIQAWIVKPYRIPSGSMEPTLTVGQRILVDRVGMHFSAIKVGDILVFHPAANFTSCADQSQGQTDNGQYEPQACDVAQRTASSETFVKRVVGLPGDRLQIINGHVIRNGRRESDPYIVQCAGNAVCNFPQTIVVPRDDYYMMGDNRPDSEDSRFWGPVRRSWIIGRVFFTYWPIDRIGFL